MKLSQVLQSIFIGLVLLGLFATMAQNTYGLTLMGISCFGLALLYFAELSWKVTEDFSSLEKKDIIGLSELLVLSLLLLLFGFRVFYINIPYSDLIFITLCGLLIVVYSLISARIIKTTKNENPDLARTATFFYSSILIFLLSLGTRIINQSLSAVVGALGLIISVPFLIPLLRRTQYEYSARTITIFQFIVSSRNKAGMLFLFFTLSAFYMGLSYFRIIPGIENAEKPGTYIELINQAETGKEKPVNGKYQHEIYKESMDKFLLRHGSKKVKK
jgi:hypothetical protein